MPSKSTFTPLQLNRLYNVKSDVFKSAGEGTYNSENENIDHPKFVGMQRGVHWRISIQRHII